MSCQSKWCTWISTISQLAVASVIVYAGLIVNTHMESWTASFKQGSEDLHSIRENMNAMTYSMESINKDMDKMNQSTVKMEKHMVNLNNNIVTISQQMDYMNYSVGGIQKKFSPQGMMKSFMPF